VGPLEKHNRARHSGCFLLQFHECVMGQLAGETPDSLIGALAPLALLGFPKKFLPHRQAIRCPVVVNLLEFLASS
jgi:hypothetical protein